MRRFRISWKSPNRRKTGINDWRLRYFSVRSRSTPTPSGILVIIPILALPALRALCERALLENREVDRYLLGGIVAADGLIGIARLLNHGCDGQFKCASCGWGYEFIRFGERIAVYADTLRGAPNEDKGLRDFQDGAPSRADGFMTPITEGGVLDARVAELLALAKRAPNPPCCCAISLGASFAANAACKGRCIPHGDPLVRRVAEAQMDQVQPKEECRSARAQPGEGRSWH
jgi:hypothetical protein